MIAVCTVHYAWLRYLHYTDQVLSIITVQQDYGLRARDVGQAWHALFVDGSAHNLWGEGVVPFLTYMFLHGGPVHLLTNMLCLMVLGSRLESRSSPLRFLLFYMLCGILAGLTQCLWTSDPRDFVIGSSGAIAGVIGAYLLYARRARIVVLVAPLPLFVEIPFWVLAAAWVLLQLRPVREFLMMGQGRPVSHMAHLGGFLAGLALAWLLWKGKRRATATGYRPFHRAGPGTS
ncbi:MAG: rhomboid family intramembrane serine protease [Planctomycetota bacterium]